MIGVMLIGGVSLFVALCIGELIVPLRTPIVKTLEEPVPCVLNPPATRASPSAGLPHRPAHAR